MSDITRDDLYIWRAIMDRQNGDRIEHRRITDEDVPAILRALENGPIWWCFEHGASVPDGNFEMCAHFEWQLAMGRTIAPCDIAEATRPRRIE